MPDHFVVLRHQEGDDWDYVVIDISVRKQPSRPLRQRIPVVTFGPGTTTPSSQGHRGQSSPGKWGLGGSGKPGAIYTVGVHRPVAGHREQLEKALSQPPDPGSKIQTGTLLLQHLEGGNWTFLAITRYDSWQDFATDRAAAPTGAAAGGWSDIRQHSAFHRDTIADRVHPAK